ncbi:MAG: SBBP repeat-containing protein, partial [Ginsengibacter sp.]
MSNFKLYPSLFFTILFTLFVGNSIFAQIQFIENKGQWDSRIKYMSQAGDGSFFLQQKGYTITQHDPEDVGAMMRNNHNHANEDSGAHSSSRPGKIKSHSYTVEFLNASHAQIVPEKPIPTVNNYFIGNDKSKWASECKIYQVITYKNIYPGIDARYYVDGASNLKYDLIVHPGGDIDKIAMKYSGASKINIKNKELEISTPLGKSKELQPYTYQVINNQRQEVECRYEVKGDVVKFKVKNYSPDQTLIIDPTQVFFSYSGSTADNWGFTATYGPDGSFYGGGIVWDAGFPVSPGAYDASFGGKFDIGIIKLSPDGKNRIYATYIGGDSKEQPHSLIVDPQGNLILAGRTNSSDYPTTNRFGPGGDWDIVVTKLNATGSAIIGSLRIGGGGPDGVNISDNDVQKLNTLKRNYGDDARSEVILDGSNTIYVASSTSSPDFPVTAGAVQSTIGGLQDGVVLKIDPSCNSVLASTLLGGAKNDAAYVLSLNNNGNIYVAGGTGSSNMTGISPAGVVKPAFSEPGVTDDDCDGYIIELNPNFTATVKGTYIGTSKADQIYGIETDKFGFIYVMGTSDGNMPVLNAAFSTPGGKQFI